MEQFPRISVVIPAYNAAQTIARACRSVLNQSYPNVELIVVNDGSKDDTRAVLDGLAAEYGNLRCVHQENGGVCRARNTGLNAMTGEYLFFLDADDEILPDALEKLYRVSEEQDCDVVAGPSITCRADGSETPDFYESGKELTIWEGLEGLRNSLMDHPATYSVWGNLYRRKVVESVRFVEGRRIHEDSFFYFEVLNRNLRMAVTNIHTVRYYMTQNSASRARFDERFLDILYFAQRKQEIVQQQHPALLDAACTMQVKANMAFLKAIPLTKDDRPFRSYEKQCLTVVRENARYFVPAITMDKILFLFIRLRLFWLFKSLYRLLR